MSTTASGAARNATERLATGHVQHLDKGDVAGFIQAMKPLTQQVLRELT